MKNHIAFLIFICILFLIGLPYYQYTEGFTQPTSDTTHNVDLPLTTTYSCQNFCGPTARCSITGQQCFADIDCPGCEPVYKNESIDGSDKLTIDATPTYSILTTDIGTQATTISDKKPAMADFGLNVWKSSFNRSEKEFDKRYKPPQLPNMPSYPKKYTMTGEFIDDGPLPSNG